MSTNLPSTDRDNEYIRLHMVGVLQARIFGALIAAAQHRKDADGLSRKAISDLLGKDEAATSKLFSRPSNMTIKTIAEVCFALEVELQFALVDRKDEYRVFLDVGMRYRKVHPAQDISRSSQASSISNDPTPYISQIKKMAPFREVRRTKWSLEPASINERRLQQTIFKSERTHEEG